MEQKLARQFVEGAEDAESFSSERSTHDRSRRRLEPTPVVTEYDRVAPTVSDIGFRDTFQSAAKKAFEGVPGMLHTIQRVQQQCQMARYQQTFEELQVLILQDTEYPSLKASDKTMFLQKLLGILSALTTAGMDIKIKLKFFEIIKRMSSDTIQRSSTQTLFSSAEEAIFGPLHEHKETLDAKLSSISAKVASKDTVFHYDCEDDVFLIDKILYNVETSRKLLEVGFQFAKARKEKDKSGQLEHLFAKIGGTATCDGECIGWLVAHGLKFAWQTAVSGVTSKKTAAQILIIEKYNDLVLKQPQTIFVEQAKLWVADLGGILSTRFADFQPDKDWLIAYACMECLLNIAYRFPQAQEEVIKVLSMPFRFKLKGSMNPLKRVRNAFDDRETAEFQRRIKFKCVEVLAQLRLWGQERVRRQASKLLDDHRSQGAPIANNTATCWRHYMSQDTASHAMMLSAPAAADFMWAETALAGCRSLFKKEPLLEANNILRILGQQFQRSDCVDLSASDLVKYTWTHVPLEIVQELEDRMVLAMVGNWTVDVCRELFLRTLMLACSCKLKSIRIPDHLGMQDSLPGLGLAAMPFDQEQAEDIITGDLSGTGSLVDSEDGSQQQNGAPHSNNSSATSMEEDNVVVEVSPAQLEEVHRSIRIITEHIEQGSASNTDRLGGLRNVVIVGVTGSGKSTMANALAGCTIRQLEHEEAEAQSAPLDAVTVVPVSAGGARDPVSKIGNHAHQSETEVLKAIEILSEESPEQSFMLWDAPGFLDSHGPEVNIANAVNLTNLIKTSQQEGLVVVVVLDAPSFTASRGAALKETVKILVHLLGDEHAQLDSSLLSSILFCVTKADPTKHTLRSLREWIVKAAPEGLELDGHHNQIVVFDPLGSNPEGCGPGDLRRRLLGMLTMRHVDKVFTTSLTDADTNLLARIAHVLAIDVAASLEKCDFQSVRTHLRLFNSLHVITNRDIDQYSSQVFGSIQDRVTKWSYFLKDHVNEYNLPARKQMRGYLDKLKQAQVLEDTLQQEFSIKRLYEECYRKIQCSERQKQVQENQDLESSFTKAKARLRTALVELSASNPDYFQRFDVANWGCGDCVRSYASVKEVQDIKLVLDKAEKFASGRMPDQLYVFGEQGDLNSLLRTFEDHVLRLFQEARHNSRGTVLDRQFPSALAELQVQIQEQLDAKSQEQVDFFSKAALSVSDVLSLVLQGMDPSAEKLHALLVELQRGFPAVYQGRKAELTAYFQEVHQKAVDIKVQRAAGMIRGMQDAFARTVEGAMKQWAAKISEGGKDFLKAELRVLHRDYDARWYEVSEHASMTSAADVKRTLCARECKVLDELVLSADAFVNQTAAEISDTEMKIRRSIERLQTLSFEVVKMEYAQLQMKRLFVADILDLTSWGFEFDLINELDALIKRLAELDCSLHQSMSAELDCFLEQLMHRAEAECAAAALGREFMSFEDSFRAQLPEKANSIVDGKIDVLVELRLAVTQYESLWDTLRSRSEVPTVADTIRRLKREEHEIGDGLQGEAAQFLRNLDADRKQRDLQFEQSFTAIKQEVQKVVREQYKALRTLKTDRVSVLADFGFNRDRVRELAGLLAVLKEDDRPSYIRHTKQLNKFYDKVRQLAEAFFCSAEYRKLLAKFCKRIREGIYDMAPRLSPGGKPALEQELDRTYPQHKELLNALIDGPFAAQPAVKTLASSAEEEKESLLSQLALDLENHLKNLHADRKQLHQQYSAYILNLRSATDVIEKHCEQLTAHRLGEADVLALHEFGFDKTVVHEVDRLLKQFQKNDTQIYPSRRAELLEALESIRKMATDQWVEKLKILVLDRLEQHKVEVLNDIDSMAPGIVDCTISLEDKLMPSSVVKLVSAIASLECDRARLALRQVEEQRKRIVDSLRTSAQERLAVLQVQAKMLRREAITTKITNIITKLPKHQEKDQRELASEMDSLLEFDGRSREYQQMVAAVRSQLDVMQDIADIQRMIGSKDFIGLNARVQMLHRLEKLLHKHMKVDVRLGDEVVKQMGVLIDEVKQELNADISSSSYLQFTRLRYFCTVYQAVEKTFTDLPKVRRIFVKEAQGKLCEMLARVRDIATQEQVDNDLNTESQQAVAKLLIKGYGVSFELQFVDLFKTQVHSQIIRKCGDRHKYQIGSALMQYATEHHSEDDGVKEMASIIIDTFPAFKSFNIALFNPKAGGVTFEDAMHKLQCEGPCNAAALQQAYEAFSAEYNTLVNQVIQDLDGFPRESVKDQIFACSKGLVPSATKLNTKTEEFGRLLGKVCGLWTYLSCRGTSSGMEKRYVLQPHSTQVLGILRLLGLDQNSLENHLIQINTGEGKSIALGFTATVLALLGFHVDVVCYSRYLSERDHNAFITLFQFLKVDSKIFYSDFEQLSSRIMKDGALDFPDMSQVFTSFLKGNRYKHSPTQKGKSVLLMDEVDVFFSDAFYGMTYNPTANLDDTEARRLVVFVWDNRNRLYDCEKDVKELLARPEAKSLQKRYGRLTDGLLKIQFRKLLQAVQLFPVGGLPKLEGMHDYVLDHKEQRIGYQDPVSGVPNYSWSYGYITAFTYMHCVQRKKLQFDRVQQHVTMQFDCGSLLYSRIPSFYSVCLGMTGTLDCLSEAQNALLRKFGFVRRTLLPSTFKRQGLNKKERAEDVSTVVEVGSYDEYFETIKKEIEAQVTRGRATLVVFEDQARLERFEREIKLRQPNLPQYRPPRVLSDKLSNSERDYVVVLAIRRFATTLVTRSYGRGTDFVCRDEGLVKNGGVHLIVTFYPQDESENKQINGRTCRQDNPGSARKILFEEDLKHLAATETDMARAGLSWDKYLAKRRTDKEKDRYEAMEESEARNTQSYNNTLQVCRAVEQGQWDVAAAVFEKFGEARHDAFADRFRPVAGACRLMCLSDATGSMQHLWAAALKHINTVLERIDRIAAGRGAIEIKWVAFRDYDTQVLEESSWTHDASSLATFLGGVLCDGGADFEEAIDCALHCANCEPHPPTQVLLIGDAPPHTEAVGDKLEGCQNQTLLYDYRQECAQLKAKGIPVHTFALGDNDLTKTAFKEIASMTGGQFQLFSVENLLDVLCLQALDQMGGAELTKKYKVEYMGLSHI